ncbi:YdcF family protein [Salinicoccus carnicancri]|uniref:YdcF family protein n=1 Tax=Salinicoccus carnicancri TaxID=558170 RepID=UPI0003087564|nr:YdcF family protein [Salinicoccus carnicancri]
MKTRILIIAICLLLLMLVILLIDSFNHNYSDNPVQSDVIVMLGGDGGRMEKTADLYKAGYADHVLITPVVETETLSQSTALAVEYGIPESALIKDYEADSTYTNATITMDIMEAQGFHSALVVTSDYHVKRSKYIFEKLNDDRFEFRYIAALSTDGERWYEGPGAAYIWRSELIKLWGYRFGLYRWVG